MFEPVEMGGLRLKNRLVRSATWEAIAAPDGGIDEAAYGIYDELARGGVGLAITGFTSVAGNDRSFGGMMRLHDDALVPQYAKLVDMVHAQGVPVLAQLALGGFYREDGRRVEPDGMTVGEIRRVERWFVDAAARAKAAGFDGVQVHVAHFFFLSRFVSPAVNHRADEYGSSAENRARIVCEIVRGIREREPELHICAKVNSNDFTPGGLDEEGALELCRLLADAGVDSIEASGNGTSVAGVRAGRGEAYFAPFAKRLAAEVDVPVMLVGGLRSREAMQRVLDETGVELLSLSRPLLFDPAFPNKLQSGELDESACISCNACYSSHQHRCVFGKAAKRGQTPNCQMEVTCQQN
ncbi:MAG: NADH:flavin oxidoreductase [Eggerthellaceae bacterium]|nr:NADH:flavin oxidoreductase [Eggerthellaceae bacterium]